MDHLLSQITHHLAKLAPEHMREETEAGFAALLRKAVILGAQVLDAEANDLNALTSKPPEVAS
ncbi:MAG: hypothetical protein GY822_21665 [Deltaproteobacteria bacterium]|nr:hypothetical protein [Deltaproteobacteria bacterium]